MGGFLTIKEAVNSYIDGCQVKAKLSWGRLIAKAVLAGGMIALGAAGSSVAGHAVTNVGLSRVVAGCVFPMGLMMVILLGAELFTGDCLMCVAVASHKDTMKEYIRVLIGVFIGNFIGAALIAWMVMQSGQFNYSDGLLGAYTIKVALGKANLSFMTALISGILCNILVCAAVIMAVCAKDITGKLLCSFFIILLFVTSGYEHCVANMYYISAGLFAKTNPQYVQVAMDTYHITAEKLSTLNVYNFLVTNLIPVTIGNIIGGVIFVGLPLYYINREKKSADK